MDLIDLMDTMDLIIGRSKRYLSPERATFLTNADLQILILYTISSKIVIIKFRRILFCQI